ncbi:hypothetical protein LBMAG42_48850 [Deltaproteobacteria bacterium]|nr:hypothetical protein LBMAG42_48850 [Deltaproteobacteria bacterium]
MILTLAASAAFACGGFVPTAGALAASDAQQALFDLGESSITVTYRARYEGNAADFAWVLAVPGTITLVEEGDEALLDDIEATSAPQVELDPDIGTETGCGCEGDAKAGSDGRNFSDTGDSGIEITGHGYAGGYEYTTLAASDADSLVTWLTDHSYDVSLIQASIEAYVADPIGFEFVAVQLTPEVAQTANGGVEIDPLAITYGAGDDGALHALFPATLGVTSSVDYVRTEIFVLGSGTATLSGWEAVANPDTVPGDVVAPDYIDPEGMYQSLLLSHGDTERKMWLAWSGAYTTPAGDRWLTRYDAMVTPATNTVDPVFADSSDKTEAETILYIMEEGNYQESYPGGAWGVVGLLSLWGLRRASKKK